MRTQFYFAITILLLIMGYFIMPKDFHDNFIFGMLALIAVFLLFIHQQNVMIMANEQDFAAQLDRIDQGTTQVANELRALKDELAGQGLSKEVEDRVFARLTKAADTLEAVGKPEEGSQSDSGGTDAGNQG